MRGGRSWRRSRETVARKGNVVKKDSARIDLGVRIATACFLFFVAAGLAPAWADDALPALLAQGVEGLSFSPDGSKVLVSMSAPDGVLNAFAIPAAGGAPVRLTRSAKYPVRAESYFPRDERFVFRGRKAEGEPEHLYVRELDGSETDLTPGKPSRFKGWSSDGKTFLVEEDQRASGAHNLLEVSTAPGYARKILYQNIAATPLAFASPDRRFLVFTQTVFDLSREVHIYERSTARVRYLRSGEGEIVHLPVAFSPDGGSLLFLNDAAREFLFLSRLDLATGVRADLLKKDWDVLGASYSPDGKLLAVTVGGDASSHVELYEASTMRPLELPGMPVDGEVAALAFTPDSKSLAVLSSASDAPPQVRIWNLTKTGPPRELIGSGRPAVSSLAAGKVVRFPSVDGKQIPGILFQPPGAAPGHKVPAVIWVHDGPSQQTRLGFDPLFQIPRLPRLRRPRRQPPGELRLRQELPAGGRHPARRRGPRRLRGRQGAAPGHGLDRRRPHRHRRPGAWRLPGRGRPRATAPGARRRDRPLRRARLGAALQLPAARRPGPPLALRGDGGRLEHRGLPAGLAPVPCRRHRPSAARGPGRGRHGGRPPGGGRAGGGGEGEGGGGGGAAAAGRGARLLAGGEPGGGLPGGGRFPRPQPQGAGEAASREKEVSSIPRACSSSGRRGSQSAAVSRSHS